MDIKVLNKNNGKIEFLLKGVNPAIVNTLRRIVTSEVPSLAIESLNVIKNSSAMYDEVLAHRLGLVPLTTDLKSYTLRGECKCKGKGCALCRLNMKLEAKGPCMVYAEMIKSRDSKVKSVYPKMPLVNLLKGQELKLEMTAVLGQGKEHMKFSPGLMFYRGYPSVKASGDIKNAEEVAKICPVKILEWKDKKIRVKDVEKCVLCNACVEVSNGAVEVKGSDEDFIVTVEPWGQLKAKAMLNEAVKIFDKKLTLLEREVKKVK